MDEMFLSVLLFIFILINFHEAKNSCNDECLSKTYCISSDGSGVCSENNLVTVNFKVIPFSGEYGRLQLTLKGYKIASDDQKTIKLDLEANSLSSNVYSCHKSSCGLTYATFDRGNFSSTIGSSFYSDGVLYCVWTLNLGEPIWPRYTDIDHVDMIRESLLSITLHHDSEKVKVAEDTSRLPIYHAQYLKCCNKVHGNDQFLLTFDQTENQTLYHLYYFRFLTHQVCVNLTRKDGIILQFKCDFKHENFSSSVRNGTQKISIEKQLSKPVVFDHKTCSWVTPFVLGDSNNSIDVSKSVFDLKVEVGHHLIYTEKDITLTNLSHLVESSFLFIIFPVLFQLLIIH